MLFLIREVRARRDGTAEYTDREVSASELAIGCGADQDIQLEGIGIAARHAVIRTGRGGMSIACRGSNRIVIAGARVKNAAFGAGTEAHASGHRLVAIAPPNGFDGALEVHFGVGLQAADFEKTFVTRLEQTWLRRRPFAWASVVVVLIAFLAVPLWLAQHRNAGRPALPDLARVLPSDRLWSPAAALIPAHQQAIGDNCGACHKRLFQPVQDSSCADCHRSVHEHVSADHLKLTRFPPSAPSCESCHREHQLPASAIIVRDDALCVTCHGRPAADFGNVSVQQGDASRDRDVIQTVSSFDAAGHPNFKVHLLRPVADDPLAGTPEAQWRYVTTPLDKAKEMSNLKYSHAQHLDAKRVASNSHDGGMACADCHVLNPDGLSFRPITMGNACISCHELTFDPTEPRRQLPHGKPREVISTIEEFYARRYLEPNAVPVPTFIRRLTPGEADKVDVTRCTESAAVCAPRAAARVIESQFNARGCYSCHNITDNHNSDIGERFGVVAVRLGTTFYPHARFKHSSHLIQNDLTGDAACESCHGAGKSADSSNVLVPGIDKCLGCHSDAAGDTRPQRVLDQQRDPADVRRSIVPLGCVGCHSYHPDIRTQPETLPHTAAR